MNNRWKFSTLFSMLTAALVSLGDEVQVSFSNPVMLGQIGIDPGQFKCPTDVAVGPGREVYVIDSLNVRVEVFDADLLSWKRGYTPRVPTLRGIAVDPEGNSYVIDGNQTIEKHAPDGSLVTSWRAENVGPGVSTETISIDPVSGHILVGMSPTGIGRIGTWMPNGTLVNFWQAQGCYALTTTPAGTIFGGGWVELVEYSTQGTILQSRYWGDSVGGLACDSEGLIYYRDTSAIHVLDKDGKQSGWYSIRSPNPLTDADIAFCAPNHLFAVARDHNKVLRLEVTKNRSARVTVSSVGQGTVRLEPPSTDGRYTLGTSVNIIAVPVNGFNFVRWRAGLIGAQNPNSLLVANDTSVVAEFTQRLHAQAAAGGTIVVTPNKTEFLIGDTVELRAQPNRWHQFASWSDGSTSNPRVMTIGTNVTTCVAQFKETEPLEKIVVGGTPLEQPVGMPVLLVNGTVALSQVFASGEARIAFETTFSGGRVFYRLDGGDPALGGFEYEGPFVVKSSCTVHAISYSSNFARSVDGDPVEVLLIPPVTAFSDGGGIAEVTQSNRYTMIHATPAPGWEFLEWRGDGTGTYTPLTLVAHEPLIVKAVFATRVNTRDVGGGQIEVEPGADRHPYGTVLKATATPADGNVFLYWGDAATGNQNPYLHKVTSANPTLVAVFGALGSYCALNTQTEGWGEIETEPPITQFPKGSVAVLRATPASGQAFIGWEGDAAGVENPLSITLDTNKTITARFTSHPKLVFHSSIRNSGSKNHLVVYGMPGKAYTIERSPDLLTWADVQTITNRFDAADFYDRVSTNSANGYYRLRSE